MRYITRKNVIAALMIAIATFSGPIHACLWDSDTFATEAKGLPDAVWILVGRFERNPPLYYEMRLKRASATIEANADDLAAYDDAGASCDRLGRGDEAIGWMERKRAVLDRHARDRHESAEQRYRYLANAGTFWAHRWIRNGAAHDRIGELQTARDFIAEAVKLNPNAHFGREVYQLKALDWMIEPPAYDETKDPFVPPFIDFQNTAERAKAHAAIEGLTGIVALGNAWENVDLFNTLIAACQADDQRTSLAYLARWRCEEMIDAGRKSLHPGAPDGSRLKQALAYIMDEPTDLKQLRKIYETLRSEAETWHEARTRFMLERLNAGRHPDNDATFWDGYHEAPRPSLAWLSRYEPIVRKLKDAREATSPYLVPLCMTVVVAAIGIVAFVARRRRKPAELFPIDFKMDETR